MQRAQAELGLAQERTGEAKLALKSLQRAVVLDPKNEFAQYSLALALAGQGRFQEALQAFERVLEINPKNDLAKYSINVTSSQLY